MEQRRKEIIMFSLAGAVPVIWVALLIAPYASSLMNVIENAESVFADPYHIDIVPGSIRIVLLFLTAYAFGIGIYLSMLRNYRRGEEHGSAKWGDATLVNRKYRQRPWNMNKLLTRKVAIGLDGKKHRRNLNVLVIGGSGAGKTRFYCKPNLMQANTSFVVLDPKGETKYSHFFNTFFQKKGDAING